MRFPSNLFAWTEPRIRVKSGKLLHCHHVYTRSNECSFPNSELALKETRCHLLKGSKEASGVLGEASRNSAGKTTVRRRERERGAAEKVRNQEIRV